MQKTEHTRSDRKRNLLLFLIFCCAAGWLFYQLYPLLMGTHDDMLNYVLMRQGNMFQSGLDAAKRGRISQIWDYPLLGFPFLLNKVWFYKLVVYTSYLFDVWSMWLLLSRHVSRDFAALTAILTVAWSTLTPYHNLLISYGCCHQLPLGLAFLSLYFYCNFLRDGKKMHLLRSSLLLLAAVMIYEAFSTLVLIFGLLALVHREDKKTSFFGHIGKTFLRVILPVFLVVSYILVYYLWQWNYPSAYGGTELNFSEPLLSLKAWSKFSLGYFPLAGLVKHIAETKHDFAYYIGQLPPAVIVIAVLVCVAAVLLIPRIQIKRRVYWRLLLCSLLGTFLPCVLISFSTKYRGWSERGVIAYLPSYYSFFFLMIFLVCILWGAYHVLKPKWLRVTMLTGILICLFGVTLSSGIVTNIWHRHYQKLTLRYRNFDYAVSTEPITACDDTWQVYAPDNIGIHKLDEFTELLLNVYNPADVRYVHESAAILEDRRILCMRCPENYAFAVIGEADTSMQAEQLTLRTLVPEQFDVSLKTVNGEFVTFTDVAEGDVLSAPNGDAFDMSVRVRVVG